MIDAWIFDLDGVIVDTAHYHFLAWKRLAVELGHDLTVEENERLKGVSRMESLEVVLSLAGVTLTPEHKQLLAEKKNRWFNEYIDQMTPDETFPGVLQLIEDLRKRGLKVGLASSSRNAAKVLARLELENQFDAIIDGNMIQHTKPHPEIFLKAANLLDVEPGRCVVVEDAEAGVVAAKAAGMKCIGIGSTAVLGGANRVFQRTSEIELSSIGELTR